MIILELIILAVLIMTFSALVLRAWEKQEIKNYYRQINRELEDDDKSRN